MNSSNIKRVANIFAAWQNAHGGQGPKDAESIKSFARGIPPDALQNMKVDVNNLDAHFVSERDGKPFKIKYGAFRATMGPHIPIVFEEVGIGGTRQVAWTNAAVEDVDETRYQHLWNEAGTATTPNISAPDAGASKTAEKPAAK